MKNAPMFWLAVALVALVTLSDAFFIVDQRERAVTLQLGEFQGTDYPPGLHVKIPFIQEVRKFDRRLLMLDSDTESFLTSEKKNVQVDYYVKWRIADAAAYYRATGGQLLVAADRLSAIVNRGMRDQFGSLTIQQAVSGERDQITKAVMGSAGENIRDLGIELMDVRVKRIDLPTEVSESVYDRMRAERKRVASDLRARGAEGSKSWGRAEVAYANLRSIRARTAIPFGELEMLLATRAVAGEPIDEIVLARDVVIALIEQEDAVLAELAPN